MKSGLEQFALYVVLVLSLSSIALAQTTTAKLLGTVKDASGSVGPGATLTARSVDTNQSRTTVSSADGAYRFESIPVGNYGIRAQAVGFKTEVRTGLTLAIADQATMDVVFAAGPNGAEDSVLKRMEPVPMASLPYTPVWRIQ